MGLIAMFAMSMAAPDAEASAEAEAKPEYYYGGQYNGPHHQYYRGYNGYNGHYRGQGYNYNGYMDTMDSTDTVVIATTTSTTLVMNSRDINISIETPDLPEDSSNQTCYYA